MILLQNHLDSREHRAQPSSPNPRLRRPIQEDHQSRPIKKTSNKIPYYKFKFSGIFTLNKIVYLHCIRLRLFSCTYRDDYHELWLHGIFYILHLKLHSHRVLAIAGEFVHQPKCINKQ